MKHLMRAALVVGALFAYGARAQAQENQCQLNLSEAPRLRGFRLGMSADDVIIRVPSIEIPEADEFGFAKGVIYTSTANLSANKADFADVSRVSLSFLDGRLTSILVVYDSSLSWESTDEFVSVISKPLGIPGPWQTFDTWKKSVRCNGFRATAGAGVETFILLEESGAEQIIKQRQLARQKNRKALEEAKRRQEKEQKEERRKTFKP